MSPAQEGVKKLVAVSAIPASTTEATRKNVSREAPEQIAIEMVSCIQYPVRFRKDQDETQALIDSDSEVNAIQPAYAKKLGLTIRKTEVGAQKINGSPINGSPLETYGMVIAGFQVQDKLRRFCFFQETFLLADTSMEVVLGMPFFTFSNVEVGFVERELTWRSYTSRGLSK